ncbi:hypothetical protein M422DRAFT_268823 [Sphaerobolus stellatus SS14]|uniref:Uncharacterized protein n=1 Tax=Sphaerobolus stellatus (strain SS14) TaxID=990650 RepID=A0A0C9ULI8_SPHS4|nr:hypothetical protein M422DRAFT_268823 [Sphaerobolus stellatus SS14]
MRDLPKLDHRFHAYVTRRGRRYMRRITSTHKSFMFTTNYSFYNLCIQDFFPLLTPVLRNNESQYILRESLAHTIWETMLQQRGRILAAGNNWIESTGAPLPEQVPLDKVERLNIGPPPLPPPHYLHFNFLLLPGSKEELTYCFSLVQDYIRGMIVWENKAERKCEVARNTEWSWMEPAEDVEVTTKNLTRGGVPFSPGELIKVKHALGNPTADNHNVNIPGSWTGPPTSIGSPIPMLPSSPNSSPILSHLNEDQSMRSDIEDLQYPNTGPSHQANVLAACSTLAEPIQLPSTMEATRERLRVVAQEVSDLPFSSFVRILERKYPGARFRLLPGHHSNPSSAENQESFNVVVQAVQEYGI